MELTWTEKRRIGEALGYRVSQNQYGGWELTNVEALRIPRFTAMKTEQFAWDAYQPDVLGEVIPWLEKNAMGWGCGQESMNGDYVAEWREAVVMGDTFSEAVCALMLSVLEEGVTA